MCLGIVKKFLIILVIIISSVLTRKIFEEITHAHKKNEGKEKNKERLYIISKGPQQGTCYLCNATMGIPFIAIMGF